MEPDPAPDPDPADGRAEAALARLARPAGPGRGARMRIGVGAAVVLLIAALATAVVVSAVGGQATHQVITPGKAPNGIDSNGTDSNGAASNGIVPNNTGSSDLTSPSGAVIFVHVLGAVRRPGLFELGVDARVIDAVAAAGGLTETADPAGANLARRLSDGEQLYLPQLGEVTPVAPAASGQTGGGASGPKVNLNTATVDELDTLPRIGPMMAQRIIDFREANGNFATVDDLRNVTGIGDKTFEGLKDLIIT